MDEFDCSKCSGKGWVPEHSFDLYTICPKCHGKKRLDWVEMATQTIKPLPGSEEHFKVSHYNIHSLVNLLREECYKVNIQVDIHFDTIRDRTKNIIFPNGGKYV